MPLVPHARFAGSSKCGVRGDVIQQLDGSVGDVLTALGRLKLEENTLLLFTSDNGPVVDDGYADGAVEQLNGHLPAGPLRGGKYSLYEGGTRLPLIASWPGKIKPGVSEALICQVDFMASFAALAGVELPADAGPDSLNLQAALLGGPRETGREYLIEHSGGLALRKGPWKFMPNMPKTGSPDPSRHQLFNLAEDVGEKKNVAEQHPELVKELSEELDRLRKNGRSRP